MKKMIMGKASAVLFCIALGFGVSHAQQAGQIKGEGEVGAAEPAGKAPSQPASMLLAEKKAAAQKLLEEIIQDKGFSTDRERRVTELLKKLADVSFQVREKATEELCKEDNEIVPLVEKAAESDDAEVKTRCEIILKAIKGKGRNAGSDVAGAVYVLAQAGQTRVVGTLIDLLSHRDAAIRAAAAQNLLRLTGESFGYKAADEAEKRQKSLEQWKTWWGKNQATFAFKTIMQAGILLCDLEAKTVTAFSMQGETLWTKTFEDPPSSAVGLPGGNILIGFRTEPGYAAEYDSTGKEIWSTKDFKLEVSSICAEASRMANGNTLLAFPHDGKVIEVTPKGKIAFQIAELGHPHAAQPTGDGNIIVMEHVPFKISIYDHQGKAVKTIKPEGVGVDAVPLPDGHILVSLLGGNPHIQELDADGNSVWSRDCPATVSTALRLTDGNTVLSNGGEGVVIVNQQGEVITTLVKHSNYQPWTGKIRLMSQLPGKAATTAPASTQSESRPASGPATER